MNKFSTRLAELIANEDKLQVDISKDLHISKQKLSNWKNGYAEPCIDDLMRLADYFDVTVDYLIGKTDTY